MGYLELFLFRFRDNPPGASTSTAITELRRYGDDLRDTCDWVPSVLDWTRDLKIQDIDLLTKMEQLRSLRSGLQLSFYSLSFFMVVNGDLSLGQR